ncbi:MAG: M28 family metallopeptidase [Candidatus Xenobiia bacterium LiM19]
MKDESSCLSHVRSLSFPRMSGGKGEKAAGDYIHSFCADAGLSPKRHPFRASLFPSECLMRAAVLFWMIVTVLAVFVFWHDKTVTAALIVVTALSVLLLSRWHPFFERLFSVSFWNSVQSENIYASVESDKNAPWIFFMAHYDSKAQSLPIYVRAFVLISGTLGMALLACLALACAIFSDPSGILHLFAQITAVAVIIAMMCILFNRTVDTSPGAIDNATGVSVVLELAKAVSKEPPKDLNVCFLFTGAEEIGLCGAQSFLSLYGDAYRKDATFVVNLDGVGGKEKLLMVDHYGLPPVITARRLSRVTREAAETCRVDLHRVPFIMGALWDHVVWASHGYEALTLSMGGWEKSTFLIHSEHDTLENVNGHALEKSLRLCLELVKTITRETFGESVRL